MRKLYVLLLLSLVTLSVTAQRVRVTGAVVDATNAELPGVTVIEKGTSNGTVTDLDGNFSLTVAGNNSVLVFSFVGFESQEIEVGTQRSLSITMEESSQTLDDVVVVAFGTQKKEEIVGSVSTIRPSELKTPSSNLTTSLAGRMSGVIAYQRSGEPGLDNAEFFIRGVTTFGYKKDPLILIDGIELTSTDLARLNPDDISSFSIMKDATATALYGARGANGVILVTTKEGREGKAKISLRVEGSASMPTRDVELADPVTYMKLNNEAILTRDPLGRILYSDDKIENTVPGSGSYIYPTTDWKEELFKDYAMNQRVNLSVSGGGNIARYFVAGSFNQDNGVLKVDNRNNFNNNIKLRTYSLRSNVNVNVFPTTEMILRISGVFDDYKGPLYGGGDLYTRVMRANPVLFPAYYPKDKDHPFVEHIMFGNYDDGQYLNPYADLVRGYRDNSRSNVNAQIEFKQDLKFVTEGLRARARFNTTRTSYFDLSRHYSPFYYQLESYNTRENSYRVGIIDPDGGTEYLTYNEGEKRVNSTVYIETALDYNRLFADRHNLSGMLVYVLRQQLNGNAGSLQSSLPYRNLGLSGRATYGFDNRYFAEFNFGYNGSERFYKTHRWGFFPSAGLAWSISNENFFSGLKKTVDNLRLRATYGLVGNDAIGSGRFLYLSEINPNASGMSAVFGRDNGYQRNGYSVIRYSDNDITWETAKKMNAALEIGLFNKVDIIAEYFTENRYNILQERASTPASMGLWTVPAANIGKASGHGVDISVDINHYINKDMWVQGRGNFTYATSVYDVYEEYDYPNAPWRSRIGYPISQNWGYIAESLFADDAEVANSPRQFGDYMAGDIKYRDVNGDGVISTLDQVPIGYPTTPEIVYGFGFSYGYKQFDISAFFQGSGRSSFWISPSATAPFVPYYYNDSEQSSGTIFTNQLLKAYADSYWSEEKRDLYALWPRLSTYPIQNNTVSSTWFMRNGSFMRLKQVEMGYTLPNNLVKRLGMSDMRLYMNCTNLFTWSKFKLWDVEMAGNGLKYPIQKVFNVGLTLSY
jgi:TonB-linked SusC/RagA family outer membrane protein